MPYCRRAFLKTLGATAAVAATSSSFAKAQTFQLASNQYPWYTFYNRDGKNWDDHLDTGLAELARSGLTGYEPGINNLAELKRLMPLLIKHGLTMKSIYVNSVLHLKEEAQKSIENIIMLAKTAKQVGTKIVVTNPSPITWGGTDDKSDDQLIEQAKNLNALGSALRQEGMTLAYHTHDTEMRQGGREFHHMMQHTDTDVMRFCLDCHWFYRSTGNSQVALFDVIKMYGNRVVEVHLRQSVKGVWSEVFEAAGDIDYQKVIQMLRTLRLTPYYVMEQCVEDESPNTLTAAEAHIRDVQNFRKLLSSW